MLASDCYEYWLDVKITGNAIDTEELFFNDTDGYGDCELSAHLEEKYPQYKFSQSVDGNNFYTDGVNAICVVIIVEEFAHEDMHI